jgi:hypothetical protein
MLKINKNLLLKNNANLVYKYNHWEIYTVPKQIRLASIAIVTTDEISFEDDLSPEAVDELKEICKCLKRNFRDLFDMVNFDTIEIEDEGEYFSLILVPKYLKEPVFENHLFENHDITPYLETTEKFNKLNPKQIIDLTFFIAKKLESFYFLKSFLSQPVEKVIYKKDSEAVKYFWSILKEVPKAIKNDINKDYQQYFKWLKNKAIEDFKEADFKLFWKAYDHLCQVLESYDDNIIKIFKESVESDDGLEYVKIWIISRGQKAYESFLDDPQSILLEVKEVKETEFEGLIYGLYDAWEQKFPNKEDLLTEVGS